MGIEQAIEQAIEQFKRREDEEFNKFKQLIFGLGSSITPIIKPIELKPDFYRVIHYKNMLERFEMEVGEIELTQLLLRKIRENLDEFHKGHTFNVDDIQNDTVS